MNERAPRALLLALAVALALPACHEGAEADPCDGVTCSGHGDCFHDGASALCDCDSGYRAEGLECVSVAGDGDADGDTDGDADADTDADTDADADADEDAGGDGCVPADELCDGVDNDCDPTTPDGADEDWFGQPCDGDDADLCLEGTLACVGGTAEVCVGDEGDDLELCGDSLDNDCDGLTDPSWGTVAGSYVDVSASAAASFNAAVAWGSRGWGLAWQDNRDGNFEIYFARLTPQGEVLGVNRVTDADGESSFPALAWTGSRWALAWQDGRSGTLEVYLAYLDESGALVAAGGPVSANDAVADSFPALAWTGTELGVAWQQDLDGDAVHEVRFARVDASGALVGGRVEVTPDDGADSSHPTLAWSPAGAGQFAVAWNEQLPGPGYEIFLGRGAADGTPLGSATRVTDAVGQALLPSVVWNGSSYSVAWQDSRVDGRWQIYLTTVSTAGARLSATDTAVTSGSTQARVPRLAWTGTDHAVAYYFGTDAAGEARYARVSTSGAVSGPWAVSVDPPAVAPALAAAPGELGVAWQGQRGDGEGWDIVFARVGACP